MSDFTEGEWKSEDGFIWSHKDGMVKMVSDFIPVESDSRLMAQSKKMYEDVLIKLNDWWRLPNSERTIENIEPIMRSTLEILSEIDKE